MEFCWPKKKASDPPAVVILPFGEIEPGFWFFWRCSPWNSWLFLVSWTRPCEFCTCTSVPVCGCEGVTMVPLSLLDIRNCPISNLSVINSVFSHLFSSDDNGFFFHKTYDSCSDQSFLSLWRIFCTCPCFFSSSLQLLLPLPITIIIINYSACTYQITVILFFLVWHVFVVLLFHDYTFVDQIWDEKLKCLLFRFFLNKHPWFVALSPLCILNLYFWLVNF